ncbi:hypothetical protein T484DRAFT_1841528 [Baffinella frigidus]|nr:hypothetical protein T484DRAFT_1841528 [Cryptophyta sp. CCMP2293]
MRRRRCFTALVQQVARLKAAEAEGQVSSLRAADAEGQVVRLKASEAALLSEVGVVRAELVESESARAALSARTELLEERVTELVSACTMAEVAAEEATAEGARALERLEAVRGASEEGGGAAEADRAVLQLQELRKELARARREGEKRAKAEQEEAAALRVKLSVAREHQSALSARVEEVEGRLREVKEGLSFSAGAKAGSPHSSDVASLVRTLLLEEQQEWRARLQAVEAREAAASTLMQMADAAPHERP